MPLFPPSKPTTDRCCTGTAGGMGSVGGVVGRQSEPGPGALGALFLIRVYKVLFSQLFAGSCRFLPSCSEYTAGAIRRHGLMRGAWMGARRLARCHPLCEGGYDPVPDGGRTMARSADRAG